MSNIDPFSPLNELDEPIERRPKRERIKLPANDFVAIIPAQKKPKEDELWHAMLGNQTFSWQYVDAKGQLLFIQRGPKIR
jgi:hypothetical protein